MRQSLTRRSDNQDGFQNVFEAYAVLRDKTKRSLYDEALGLAEKRRSRLDLRPLAFHSKSLDAARVTWPTWERELLAVLEGVECFRQIAFGYEVHIHDDHLNNTILLTNELRNPDKILRMMLKLESMITLVWLFAPGIGQVGDGVSRNSPDCDAARDAAEKCELPKTLMEVLKMTSDNLRFNPNVDDSESIT